MKRLICRFTLVEMLTVVAIIGILAGLIIPTVAISQQRGRITQAKSDIVSISTALKGLESDYNKMLLKSGSDYKIGNQAASVSSNVATVTGDVYNAMIAELSVPKNSGLTVSVNKRKRVYLDAKSTFDPGASYSGQTAALWRDPWGNPYVVYIKTTMDNELTIPGTSKTIAGNLAIYSFGPNGEDNEGCNVDLDACISSTSKKQENHKNHDDIASWNL